MGARRLLYAMSAGDLSCLALLILLGLVRKKFSRGRKLRQESFRSIHCYTNSIGRESSLCKRLIKTYSNTLKTSNVSRDFSVRTIHQLRYLK